MPERALAPSAREAALGAVIDLDTPAVSTFDEPEPPRPPAWRGAVDSLKLLNPRGIAGGDRQALIALVVLSLTATVGSLDDQVLGAVIYLIQADMNFNFQFMATLATVFTVFSAAAAPIAGYFADRRNRVYMVRFGAIVDNLSSVATGLAPTPAFLVGARMAGATGSAVSGPASLPLLSDYFPVEKRARVFGFAFMLRSAWVTATSLFIVGAVYVWGIHWRVLLIGTGVISTIVAFSTFLLKEPIRGEVDRLSEGASPEEAKVEQRPVGWGEAWRAARSIGTLRKLWYAAPFTSLAGGASGLFLFFILQDKISRNGGTLGGSAVERLIPVLSALVPTVLGIFLTPAAVSLSNRMMQYRPGRIMFYAGVLQVMNAGILLLILVSPSVLVAVALLPVGGLCGALLAPALQTMSSSVIPARIRGQGANTLAWFAIPGSLMLRPLAGVADEYGVATAFGLVIPLMLVGAAIAMSAARDVEGDIRAALAASVADEEAKASRIRGENKMIVCRDVDVTYDGTMVLFNVDFDVQEGEIVALLGTNGAGKSTLLRAIAGIQEASNGAIFLDGEDITHKPPHLNARDGIVFLPGGRAIFPTLTVEENLRAAAWLYKDDDEWVRARTSEVLDLFPILAERMKELAGNLSGGEQQMLALSQAFLMKPRLLMIDELSLGLAPSVVERLLDVVRAIRDQGTTVILVEQSVNVALTIADRAVFMDRGRLRFDGPTEVLLSRGDLMRAVFLGGTSGAFVGSGAKRGAPGGSLDVVLGLEGVEVAYGGHKALDGVTFDVHAGEIVGIIGPNGAGKTTLFDVISGFTPADSGRVLIQGSDAGELPPDGRARLGLARSFQDTRLFPSLSVRENIAVALEQRLASKSPVLAAAWAPNLRRAERRAFRRVEYLLELLNLGLFANKFVNELSTGSRRMVDLACMMAAEPSVLLLDEPSSGLAQGEVEVLGPAIQRLARETGAGVLVIEHDIPLVTAMSDRLVAMELGRVVTEGPPGAVMSDPRVKSSYLNASASVIGRSGDRVPDLLSALDAALGDGQGEP